tara:strand:+ start:150 stop:350 length:201 start_codon:yes stop_codon:yes gene_type:complete
VDTLANEYDYFCTINDIMKDYEILRKNDGLYLFDGEYLQGPYESIKDAEKDLSNEAQIQYPLPFNE